MLRNFLRFITRWNDDSYLLFFFIFMITLVFVLGPMQLQDELRLYAQPLVGLMVVAGVFATTKILWIRWASFLAAIIDFMVTFVNSYFDHFWLEIIDISFTLIVLLFLSGAVLVRVFHDGKVNFYRILGSVSAYILIGMVFGYLYYLCWLFDPGAFISNHPLQVSADQHYDLTYFSFVTLFTVGYGDISPGIPAVRSLATLEGLIGQLYPVILIARLVSLEIEYSKR